MERRWIAGVSVVVVVLAGFIILAFTGGQTSRILSTVGSAVGNDGSSGAAAQNPPPPAGDDQRADTNAANGADAASVQPPALLIVRKGTLTLEANAIAPAVSSAASVVAAAGGFVSGSKETGASADASAVVDYRIPAPAWEATLARLRGLATVRDQDVVAEEVTGQVIDLGARIANLRATEAALQAIMAKATRIPDVLDVQKQLTATRGQIEQLTAQKSGLEDRAAFGSLTVTFRLPPVPAPAATRPPGWDPARDVDAAAGKLVRIGQKATTAGIWFAIVGLPLLIALAIALGLGWLGWRLATRIRRATESSAEVGGAG
jgi:hypothetical protein